MQPLKQTDRAGALYQFPQMPYTGPQFHRTCFVFPGQSAAQPGAGKDLFDAHDVVRARFVAADALAKNHNLPAPSLYLTDPGAIAVHDEPLIQCLALYTLSIGLFELLLLNNQRPALVTAHSFGEFAALVAAGIATFETGFELVIQRHNACPPSGSTGGMIAVNADAARVRDALNGTAAVIANINSPQQTVISAPAETLKTIAAQLKKARLAAITLDNVGQPYHSPMLAAAANTFLAATRRHSFSAPHTPMLSSVTGQIIDSTTFTRAAIDDILQRQLTAPIDFIAQSRKALAFGCHNFIEVSPLALCRPWLNASLAGETFKITVPPAFAVKKSELAASQLHDKKLVKFLNKIISKVTGYEVADIELGNAFQEDLGIDSIKKAEIVLNFLEEQGQSGKQGPMALHKIRTVDDVLAWYNETHATAANDAVTADFSLSQWQWYPHPITAFDEAVAMAPAIITWLSIKELAVGASLPTGNTVLYDDGSGVDFTAVSAAVKNAYGSLSDKSLTLVLSEQSSPAIKGLEAFLQTVAQETDSIFRSITFDVFDKTAHHALVEKEITLPQTAPVMYRNGQRYTRKLVVTASATPTSAPAIVALFGGGGVMQVLLPDMLANGTQHVHIFTRAAPPTVTDARIHYYQGDMADSGKIEAFLQSVATQHGAIDLVINAAGVQVSATLPDQNETDSYRQITPKIDGTQRILAACSNLPVNDILCFSSIVGEYGGSGQSIYAYANSTMTNLCAANPIARVIAWPAWHRTGMTASDRIHSIVRLGGHKFMTPENGRALFQAMLADKTVRHALCATAAMVRDYAADTVLPATRESLFHQTAIRSPMHLDEWTLQCAPDASEHIMLGQPVVPLSFALSLMAYTGHYVLGQTCRITNVKTESFMLLPEKESPYFLDFTSDGDALACSLRSNVDHLSATVTPGGFTTASALAWPAASTRLHIADYVYLDADALYFVISHVDVADGVTYASLDLTKTKRNFGGGPTHWLTMVCEAMMQASGMHARTFSNRYNAPQEIGEMLINPAARLTDSYRIVTTGAPTGPDTVCNSVYAYNADGVPFIAMHNQVVRLWGDVYPVKSH